MKRIVFFLLIHISLLAPRFLFGQGCFENLLKSAKNLEEQNIPFPENNFTALKRLVGCPIPTFKAVSIQGDSIKSSDLKGKVLVINFWFSSCPPCISEMPGFNRLVSEYKGKDVVFIGFSSDDKETIVDFLTRKNFDFTLMPNCISIAERFGIGLSGWPLTFVSDKNGIVRMVNMGFAAETASAQSYDEFKPIIDEYLSK